MSNTVDTRVVEMQFDNRNFEQNVKTSLSTLDKLKQALNFDNSAKQLSNLQNATNRIDFNPFLNAIDSVQERFSMMGIVGATVINNLTNSLVNKAKEIFTAIPRQISQGGMQRALNLEHANFVLEGLLLEKYEDGAARVQAMMQAANNAVSGTAYGLDEAANVASQLVASGVEDAAKMETILKGIAGAASMTGRDYANIGNIFTTVASNGRLMTQQLRQFSYAGLNVAATLAEQLGVTEQEINEMVSKGKIDFDTFATAMSNAFGKQAQKANETYTGALSNVKAALSRIGAEFKSSRIENLRKIFVEAIPVINSFKKGIADITKFINQLSTAISNKIVNVLKNINFEHTFDNISKVLKSIKIVKILVPIENALKGFGGIIKNLASSIIDGFGKGFDNTFLGSLSTVGKALISLVNWFANVTNQIAALDYVWSAISTLAQGFGVIIRNIGTIVSTVFSVLNNYLGSTFSLLEEDDTIFRKITKTIAGFVSAIGHFMISLDGFGILVSNIITGAYNGTKPVFKFISNFFNSLGTTLSNIGKLIGSVFGKITGITSEIKVDFSDIKSILDSIKKTLASTAAYIGDAFAQMWENLTAPFKNNNTNFLLTFASAFEVFIMTVLSARTLGAMKFAKITMGDINGFIKGLPGFLQEAITKVKEFVGAPFKKIAEVMDTFKETLITWQNSLKAETILKIAKAIALLAASMFVLSAIDPDRLEQSIYAVSALVMELTLSMLAFSRMKLPNMGSMMGIMSVLAALGFSVLMLSVAAKNLSGLNWEELKVGLAGIGGILAELSLFMMSSKLFGTKSVSGLISLSIAMLIFAKALKELCQINPDTLRTGLGAMGGILGEIGIFTNIINPKRIISIGIAMNIIAASLLIFAKGLTALGEIPIDKLKTGLIGMGSALGIVAIAMRMMPKGAIFDSVSMVIAAKALTILAEALAEFSKISDSGLKNGLIGMGGALAEIAVAMIFMKGSVPGAIALLLVSSALKTLSDIIKVFTAIPINKLVTGLIAFGAALTIVVLAGLGAQAAAAGLLVLGTTIALIGAGFFLAGAGLFAFCSGLALLAASVVPIQTVIMTLANSIPVLMAQFGYGIVALVDVLANSYDSFVRLGIVLIVAFCDSVIQTFPKVIELIGVLFTTLETLFFDYTPRLINLGIQFVFMLIDGITQAMPDLVDKTFVLIITFIDSMSAALDQHGPEFWDAVDNFLLSVLNFLGLKVKDWALAAKEWLKGLAQGFAEKAEEVKENIKNFVREKIIQPIKDKWEDFKNAGSYLIQGLINGIMNTPILGSIAKLGANIIGHFNNSLGEHSPSKLTEMSGEYFIEGFVNGINKNKYKITQASNGMIKALKIDGKKFTLFEDPIRKIKLDTKNFVEQSVASINWGAKTINTYIKKFGQELYNYGYTYSPSSEIDFATNSIAKLSKTLYLNSDAYKESNENVQAYVNAIKAEEDRVKSLTTEIKKQQAAADAGSDDAKNKLSSLNSELESTKNNIKNLGAGLSEELTNIANGAKNAFDSLRADISGTVTNSLDVLKVSVTDYVDLFSKFEEVQNVPVDTILKTMRSQIVGVSKWRDDLTELGKRGIADGLLDQLRNMGVNGEKYIKSFLQMTDEELNQANLMFRAKNELTSQTLIDGMKDQFKAIEKWTSNIELLATKGINFDLLMDLQEAGPDNAEYVQALADMTADQIKEVNELYKKSKTLPTSIADRVLASLALSNEGKGNIAGKDMASALAEVLNGDEIGTKFTEALAVGIKNSETDIVEASKIIGNSSLNEINKYLSTENGTYIAVNMVNGLVDGLTTGQSILADASREMARAAYQSAADELGIHSPSRAFEEIGRFSDLGLANGLSKYASVVTDASTLIGDSALKTMKESMDKITEILNNDVNSPVIKPVLDLSDISSNAGRINKMFDDQTIGANLEELPGIQNGKVFNFTQNNYSPKALSRIDIYRQTRNQFATLKGMV